jgi:hypothetical protein
MKITVFWDIAPCSLDVGRSFRGAYCLDDRDYTALYPTRLSCHHLKGCDHSGDFLVGCMQEDNNGIYVHERNKVKGFGVDPTVLG